MMAGIYRTMLEIEQKAGARDACSASMAFLDRMLAEKGQSYAEFVLAA